MRDGLDRVGDIIGDSTRVLCKEKGPAQRHYQALTGKGFFFKANFISTDLIPDGVAPKSGERERTLGRDAGWRVGVMQRSTEASQE